MTGPDRKSPAGLLTVEQVAELLQCSADTVERYIRSGDLRRVALSARDVGDRRPGPRGWRVHPDDLVAFVDARRRAEPPRAAAPVPVPVPVPVPRVFSPVACGTDGKRRSKWRKAR